MIHDLETVSVNAVVAYQRYIPFRNFRGRTEESHNKKSQPGQCPSRDSNQAPPECTSQSVAASFLLKRSRLCKKQTTRTGTEREGPPSRPLMLHLVHRAARDTRVRTIRLKSLKQILIIQTRTDMSHCELAVYGIRRRNSSTRTEPGVQQLYESHICYQSEARTP
jgi:hypothetical protein